MCKVRATHDESFHYIYYYQSSNTQLNTTLKENVRKWLLDMQETETKTEK